MQTTKPWISAFIWLLWIAVAVADNRVLRAGQVVVLHVNLQKSLNTINDHFIGQSLGFPNYGVKLAENVDLKKVVNMARALAPGYVRMSGNFVSGTPGHMIRADLWDKMNSFFKTVGWDQIHVLSDRVYNADGSWSPEKARVLLNYSATKNVIIAGFELGNEYDIYSHHSNTSLSPQQLAHGVETLRKVLDEFPLYRHSFIMGPDTASVNTYFFQGFLSAGGSQVVRAATFHQYYFAGLSADVSWFTNITIMEKLAHKIDAAKQQTHAVNPHLPVWLSETGSATQKGAPGMSDRYVAGFLWLDKLGVCAKRGIQSLNRFAFYADEDFFGLLDKNFDPNPDFWLTVLYKRIIRGAVFGVTWHNDIRTYAACANKNNFKVGSLAVYMLNPNNYSVTIDLPQFTNQSRFRYTLTPGDHDGLTSRFIALNGIKLQLVNEDLPPMKPESAPSGVVSVSAYSFTFLVFPDAAVPLCMH